MSASEIPAAAMDLRPIDDSLCQVGERIATAWNEQGVHYAVAHGLKDYPESLGRDLDVFVTAADVESALSLSVGCLNEAGFVVARPPNVWGERLIAFRESADRVESIEIHLVSRLSWGPMVLASQVHPTIELGPFRIDPWIAFVKQVMLPLLRGNRQQLGRKQAELRLRPEDTYLVADQLQKVLGRACAETLLRVLQRGDLEELLKQVPRLRRALLVRSPLRDLRGSAATLPSLLRKRTLARFEPCAPVIALVGPDGVGKSTTLQHLPDAFPQICHQTVIRHWRPGLLPHLGRFRGAPQYQPGQTVTPRTKPGRFPGLRLAYYFVDFLLGHYVKDAPLTARQNLIVYDRCALDMAVHPVRYGLSSAAGVRLLWKLVPRPDLVILLCDSPGGIEKRKTELRREEIERQFARWFDLAKQGELDAVIKIDAGPETIANRINELAVESLIRKNGGVLGMRPDPNKRLHWIARLLAGNHLQAELRFDGRSRLASRDDEGWRRVAQFGVLPRPDNPRFLVSLDEPGAIGNAIRVYNAQKPWALFARDLLTWGWRSATTRSLLGNTVSLFVKPSAAGPTHGGVPLAGHLQQILGVPKALLSISLGTPCPHQKPTIQVMNGDGDILGYAKLGWHSRSVKLVRHEEAVLGRLGAARFSTANVPGVLHAGEWNGGHLLLQQAPPADSSAPPRDLDDRHVQFLLELHRFCGAAPAEAGLEWLAEMETRVGKVKADGYAYYGHLLEQALRYCREPLLQRAVPFTFRHGDFTPWNTLAMGDRLFVFDWEYADNAPPGWDIFHFIVQSGVLLRGWSGPQIFASALAGGPTADRVTRYFETLGVERAAIRPLFAAYLAENLERSVRFDGRRTSVTEAARRRAWRSLLSILCFEQGRAQ